MAAEDTSSNIELHPVLGLDWSPSRWGSADQRGSGNLLGPDNVLRDVDWKTLIFLAAIFSLVQAFTKTGLLQGMSLQLYTWFGAEITLVALVMLAGIGLLSSLLANIPVVAASLVMAKG